MHVDVSRSLIIILLTALATFATRSIPFLIFPKGKPIPKVVRYLGKVLTPAVIGLLVIYCLRNVSFSHAPFGLPEIIAIGITAGLHLWKRNTLLSIGAGTVLYMIMVQFIF